MHLCQRFFRSSKHFSNSIFGIAFSSFSDALLMSSMAVKRRPFKVLFIFRNRKKSHGAMSGEYGGWGIVTVLFLAKNSRTSNELWAGALSWCKSHELFFHKSGRFFGLFHANSWCTMPLKSKNTVSITFTFDRTCRAIFGLGEPECLHWDDWDFTHFVTLYFIFYAKFDTNSLIHFF